jgi:hypothetical protein
MEQSWPDMQTFPHIPQFVASVARSTHTAPHADKPPAH